MKRVRTVAAAVASVVALGLIAAACGGSASGSASGGGAPLTGAGATFPDPVYEQWFKDFQKVESGAKINYQAIGSGGGVTQFTNKTVDFGASDAPLKPEEEQALPAPALEIPTVLGGVVIAYHAEGVPDGLKLDGATAANIFLGKITKWNDPAIGQLNPGATLPDLAMQVVHRSDESGTTKVFTSWLSAESPDWEQQVGADKAVQWPVGTGGDGNDGVAAAISQTDGAVGYLSFDFAVTSGLGVAQIKRDDGQFVAPSVDSISAAGGALKLPITADTNILNSPASGAYPISTSTYLLIYQDLEIIGSKDKAQTLVDLLYWCMTKGQDEVKGLNYAPLPLDVAQGAIGLLDQITYGSEKLTPSSKVK